MTEITSRLSTALADRYKLERHLGEGGMATVYLAQDLKHKRKVAVKVLRPELAAVLGAERFVQEITTTANLQHPHILPLFDSGEADSFLYYVMPFVEGETLRDKLNRETQLGIDEAVGITTDIADALDYAHQQGVIHRDIKPENILLHNGRPMVADFGIALAVSAAAGGRMTETGLSLGTPHYMSPEQATAEKDLTNRSDIYSLGCVLYEMLTGEPPHTGASAQAVVMKIVTDDARPVTELRKSVPPHVAAATAKALEKLAADRFTSAAQFAGALTNPAFAVPTVAGAAAVPATVVGPWKQVSLGLGALAAVLLVAALWGWLQPEPPPGVARYGLALPPAQAHNDVFSPSFAVAPDASWFVYMGPGEGDGQLWVKQRDSYEAIPLAGTAGAQGPVVSPDGKWIAFVAAGQLRKVPAGGGSAITLTDSVQMGIRTASWMDDGYLVYSGPEWDLRRVPDVGGPAEVIYAPETGRLALLPAGLPGGRGVLFTMCRGAGCGERAAWVLDLRSGEARQLFPDVVQLWYVATGHLVYVRPDGGAFAVPFDAGKLEVRGAPVPVLGGVQVAAGLVPDFALSTNGTLLMVAGSAEGGGAVAEAVWVDRSGTVTPIDPEWRFSPGPNQGWALSPDGTRMAIKISGEAGEDVWIKQLDRGPLSRLTFDEASDIRPRWTPDGRSVTFFSNRAGKYDLYVQRADGTGSVELLLDLEREIFEAEWTPDSEWLVIRQGGTAGGVGARDIHGIRLGVDSVPVPLVAGEFDEKAAALSPDGRWLAYESNETGGEEIYVRPFPDTDAGKWQVSAGGGRSPIWAHNGRELFYVNAANEMAVAEVTTGSTFAVGERKTLFALGAPNTEYFWGLNYRSFDLSRDDQRFLMVRAVASGDEEAPQRALILVENWFEELKAKVGN